jgi:hypothetical protein
MQHIASLTIFRISMHLVVELGALGHHNELPVRLAWPPAVKSFSCAPRIFSVENRYKGNMRGGA